VKYDFDSDAMRIREWVRKLVKVLTVFKVSKLQIIQAFICDWYFPGTTEFKYIQLVTIILTWKLKWPWKICNNPKPEQHSGELQQSMFLRAPAFWYF
jgi:hypothetical protein